jgi:DNA-binding PadR family transcriptional regulator
LPIHHAVLALLEQNPSYGYELKSRFEESVGPQWGDLNIGHLYQILDRLERDRFASKRVVAQEDRPDRVVYRLTRSGRTELDRWLETPFVRSAYRDDFFLKLFAASKLGRQRVDTLVRVQREAYLGELSALSKLRRRHRAEPLVSLLIEAAILHTKADLRLVELAEAASPTLASNDVGEVKEDGDAEESAAAGSAG